TQIRLGSTYCPALVHAHGATPILQDYKAPPTHLRTARPPRNWYLRGGRTELRQFYWRAGSRPPLLIGRWSCEEKSSGRKFSEAEDGGVLSACTERMEKEQVMGSCVQGDLPGPSHLILQDVWLTLVNRKNKEALSQWVRENNVILQQINGQRIYRGHTAGCVVEAPPFGTEVFIGSIPQEIYEDKLIPLFETVGRLFEFRLMMTFSGLNRGFAYARYFTKRQAGLAICRLNGYQIQNGCKIMVCKSTEKCELILDGLTCILDQSALTSALCEITAGIETISLFASPLADMKNIAIVKYKSHKEAALAKKSLCEGSQLLYGCPFSVDWLKPQMKQKMQSGTLLQPHVYRPERWSSSVRQDKAFAGSCVQTLHVICEQLKFGQPSYQIQFLGLGSCGWIRFSYVVALPNHSVPFSGYDWLVGEYLTPGEQYQKAKEIVALQILKKLEIISG
ncbi:dead end protein homolog 1-like, partial [Aquarana catesbeiana]|uniref:dead end protein homolog 1-like n=1 Tax=Aquarana catesbeiana TaxID=8400 RepID=UPI003CC9364F